MSSFAFFAGPPASPAIPDALPIPQVFVEPLVLCWAGGLLCLQIVLQMLFKFSSSKKMSENAGVVAHQLVVSIPFGYAAYMGVKLLYFDDKIAAMTASANYADRLYGFHATCWEMTRFFVGFQLYDLCVTLIVPSLWGPDHIAHHTLSLLTACAGTSGPNLMWYCPFFFGVVEVSSVPVRLTRPRPSDPTLVPSLLPTVPAHPELDPCSAAGLGRPLPPRAAGERDFSQCSQ